METKERKSTHLDFQFGVTVYFDRMEYDRIGAAASGETDFGGVEFGNSWKSAIAHAEKIVAENPSRICVCWDKMKRKPETVIR